MKKEVVLIFSLIITISLAGIAYSTALTNPGHGVEEIGNGTSPFGAREWNANFTEWTDFYTGPNAASVNKWDIPWFGFTNTDTRAAQNNLGDWCVDQVDPWGIYMTCFNNLTGMTLIQSYTWNGTNFTKNDTIKNGSEVFEQELVQGGPGGAMEETTVYAPTGESASKTIESVGGVITTETAIESGGVTYAQMWQGLTAGGTDGDSDIFVKGDDSQIEIKSEDDAGTTTGTTTTTPGSIIGTAENPAGDAGTVDIGADGLDFTVDLGGTQLAGASIASDGATTGDITMNVDDTVAGGTIGEVVINGDGANNGLFGVTITDNTLMNDVGIEGNSIGGTGAGSLDITTPTMTEVNSGGNFIVYLGEDGTEAGGAAAFVAGADFAHRSTFAPGAPTCVQTDETWAPGVGVTINDVDVITGLPCALPSLAFYEFYKVLND